MEPTSIFLISMPPKLKIASQFFLAMSARFSLKMLSHFGETRLGKRT
jgi:hypothetical protein